MEQRRGYCPVCETEQPVRVERVDQTFPVRGESITVKGEVAFCCRCGEEVFDPELDFASLELAYAEYRRRKALPSPRDIVAARQKYGLGQRALAKLLGWSPATIYRYEKGSIPSAAHAEILKRLDDPSEVARLLRSYGHTLSPRERARAEEAVSTSARRESEEAARAALERVMGGHAPDIENGFRRFDFEKLLNMIVFFAGTRGIAKTALMKLLWYADFLHFRRHTVSISGTRYSALPYGPTPDQHLLCLAAAVETGALSIYPVSFGKYEGERVRAEENMAEDVFTGEEWATLKEVAELGHLPATTLTNLSHREDGWRLTRPGKVISYEHALALRELPGPYLSGDDPDTL